jgi:hypothetical protein
MAYFGGEAGSQSASVIFEKAFGGAIRPDTPYYVPGKFDRRTEIGRQLRALMQKQSIGLTSGGAGTAGSAMIPVWVMPDVVDETRRQTPLVELLPRQAVMGKTVDFNALTTRADAAFNIEDAALDTQTSTYDRRSRAIKFAYSKGSVTGPAIAAMRGYQDALQLDIVDKTIALRELIEDKTINGVATTTPAEFSGFTTLITTNTRSLSGANLLISDVRTEIDTIFNKSGRCDLAIVAPATATVLKGQLMDFQRYVGEAVNLPFGIAGSFSVDGVNFVKSRFLTDAAASRRAYFLTSNSWYYGVLQDATYQELAQTNDSYPFMIKEYLVLVDKSEKMNSEITSIA